MAIATHSKQLVEKADNKKKLLTNWCICIPVARSNFAGPTKITTEIHGAMNGRFSGWFFVLSVKCNCRGHCHAIFMILAKRLPTLFADTKKKTKRLPLNCKRNWHWTMCHFKQIRLSGCRCIGQIVAMLWRRDVKRTESLASHHVSDVNWIYSPSRRHVCTLSSFALFDSTKAAVNHLMAMGHTFIWDVLTIYHSQCDDCIIFHR